MYFILSKLLIFILSPILWVFVLLIIALVTKNSKRKKRLLISSVLLLYVFANHLLFNQFARAWNIAPYPKNNKKVYSCAIVLGGFSGADNGKGYFNTNADRFIQGIKLLKTGKADHLLISGGNGNLIPGTFREGDWVRGQLKELQFPDSSILIEDRSRNTIENAVFSKAILKKANLHPPYLLVTSAFHMRRALMIFKKRGFDVDAYPCNYMGGTDAVSLSNLIPDAGALAGWDIYLKEVVGYAVDYFKK